MLPAVCLTYQGNSAMIIVEQRCETLQSQGFFLLMLGNITKIFQFRETEQIF